MNPYDAIPYGQRPFPEAHPERLFLTARAFGRPAVPVERARILELGCGEGGHLVPLSVRYPEARCVGVDLSPYAVTQARQYAAELGASATFLELDVTLAATGLRRPELPEEYDYIVAHGLYSWVPPVVREAILATCATFLSPDGLFYLSYNTRPGWHLRGMVSEILKFHTQGFSDPRKKVAQARAILGFLAEQVPKTDPYGAILHKEAALTAQQPDPWVFHDLLADDNHRFLLTEFVADLARHGLAYVGDSDVASMLPERLPPGAKEALLPFFDDPVAGEQYMDFLIGRHFRRSVGGRPAPLTAFDWKNFRQMSIRGRLQFVPEQSSATTDTFRTQLGDILSSDVPLVRAALRELTVTRGAVPWSTFVDRVLSLVSAGEDQRELLGKNLAVAWIRGGLDLHVHPRGLQGPVGTHPVVDPLVRRTAGRGDGVTNVFHEHVRTDALDRELLPMLDGTRTPEAAVAAALVPDDPIRDRVVAALPQRLARYAELGLLVA